MDSRLEVAGRAAHPMLIPLSLGLLARRPPAAGVTGVRVSALAAALVLLATACTGQETSGPTGPTEPQVQPGATLLGTVGQADDPEAYEIALTTQDGEPVETVAAGQYTIVVQDYAQTHNFHLRGQGVDMLTEVLGTGKSTFEVTFRSGEYSYICDPHPSMRGVVRAV